MNVIRGDLPWCVGAVSVGASSAREGGADRAEVSRGRSTSRIVVAGKDRTLGIDWWEQSYS